MSELAFDGGAPVRTKPWLDNFTTGEAERRALDRVLETGYLSLFEGSHSADPPFSFRGGPFVQRLEARMAKRLGVPHAVAVNSATSGLYAAIGALGIGYGDEVIVSPYTMSACAVAPLVYGAIPIFADVDERFCSLSPESVAARITPRTKAILVVHQFGIPARMDELMTLARRNSIKVIEDCAQAWDAHHAGRPVGTIGDIGVFSFNVNKTIQSGEGGLCVTKDPDLAYRLQLIRNHGEAVVGPAGYANLVNIVGFNYRMTELQAAVAGEQLEKLDRLTEARLALVDRLHQGLRCFDCVAVTPDLPDHRATYYVVPVRFDARSLGISRSDFVTRVNAEGILFRQGYVQPLYLQPMYQQRVAFKAGYPWAAPANAASRPDYSLGSCPVAERLHSDEMIINEHIRPPHDAADIDDILKAVDKVVAALRQSRPRLA